MMEQAHMLEEAVGWEFRDTSFGTEAAKRALSGFGEFLKPLWMPVFLSITGGGWNRLPPSFPSLSC